MPENGADVARTRLLYLTCCILLVVAAGACATDPAPDDHAAADPPSVVEHLSSRHDAAARAHQFDSIDDLLGNVTYRMPGRPAAPLTDTVVVGSVSDVEPGLGFYVEGDDGPTGIETTYDDPRSLWKTVHVTLAVEKVVSGKVQDDSVVVGFAFGASMPFERIESDFRSYGKLLLFAKRGLPVFDYDPSVYGTVMDGELMGFVGDDGRIELPVLRDDEAAEMLRPAPTVADLEKAAANRGRTVQLNEAGEIERGGS